MREEDAIQMAALLAVEAYERGEITRAAMLEILQCCVNARAAENGYADRFGLPSPHLSIDPAP